MTPRLEKKASTPEPKELRNSELMDILVDIVIGEVFFSYVNVVRKIKPGDIRIILKKIQDHEISTSFAPLGNLEDLAEKIFPAVEAKLEEYSKKDPGYKVYAVQNHPPTVQKYFTGKEFGLSAKRTREGTPLGFSVAHRRFMDKHLKSKKRLS
jgi:hypothetical protein